MTLSSFIRAAMHLLATASLEGAGALVAALLLAALARSGRIQSWWHRLAHLKFLLALLCITPLALPLLPAQPVARPGVIAQGAAPIELLQSIAAPSPPVARFDGPAIPAQSHAVAAASVVPGMLLSLWLLGAVFSAIRLARSYFKARAFRGRAVPFQTASVTEAAHGLARKLRLGAAPKILVSPEIASPLLTGLFRPVIILPAAIAAANSPRSLELIIAHELGHLVRRDLWWNLLPAGLLIPFFFHPILWLARREWLAAQEIACDQLTLSVTNASPGDYARTLLDIVSRSSGPGPFAAGMGTFTTKRRIKAMTHKPSRPVLALSIIALGAVLGLMPWRLVAQPNSGPERARTTRPSTGTHGAAALSTQEKSDAPATLNHENVDVPSLQYVADIDAQIVNLAPAVDGVVKTVSVSEGQRVKKGDVLFALDSNDQGTAVALAELELKSATMAFERASNGAKTGASGPAERDSAEIAHQRAEIALEKAKIDLEKCTICSPMDGVVSHEDLIAGQFAAKGKTLITIVDAGRLFVTFNVPQRLSPSVRTGQKMTFMTDAGDFDAEIIFVSPTMDASTQTCRVKAVIKSDSKDLKPGMAGFAAIPPA